jgi:hypothetical protein
MIEFDYGQPSYVLSGRQQKVTITVQGGHLRACFPHKGKEASPFFGAPWWKEAPVGGEEHVLRVLRGDFFCLPFGANAEPYRGVQYIAHGTTANGGWELDSLKAEGEEQSITLSLPVYGRGRVLKQVRLQEDAAVLYCEHRISGLSGRMPLGHHAVLQFPEGEGSGIIDLSEPLAGFTAPAPIEDPAKGGYSLLKPDLLIEDASRVPTVYGDTVDLMRYPSRDGHEDVALFVSDPAREFCYSCVTFPGEGYLYFQLKDPKVLAETLFWRSNGGRHYPPWSGRLRHVLGLEEVTSYFAYGIKQSVEPNPLAKRGFKTFIELSESKTQAVRVIMGCAPVPSGFSGVRQVSRKDGSTILIEGRGGEKLPVPCWLDFLQRGF